MRWHPLILLTLLFIGCGSPFGEVTGKVTLDGQPLPGATVEFSPADGSPAYGVTNEAGEYKLLWSSNQSGAQLGKHRVRITTFNEAKRHERERLPVRYNKKSELTAEVSSGNQVFNFDLVSK